MTGPLAGLRVVELGVWVAGPAAAALLADWGADVIKVEPPAGDPMRGVFGSLGIGDDMPNPAFALDNRGKRSVVLDLREPEARDRLEDLLATADVFVTNLRPDALDRLGLEPEATVARHPQLVYTSVSGYGLRGDDRNRPTYDLGAFWARSGLAVHMADGEGTPLNARGGIGDHITGLAALAGLLAAVLDQRATGRGRVVEVSLLRTGAYVLGWDLGIQMALGRVAGSEPRHRNQAPLALLDGIIAERPLAEWAEAFEREGVWWAPAQSPADVVADPQVLANDGVVELAGGALRSVNGPASFTGVPAPDGAHVPAVGEHTDEVLAELSRDGAG